MNVKMIPEVHLGYQVEIHMANGLPSERNYTQILGRNADHWVWMNHIHRQKASGCAPTRAMHLKTLEWLVVTLVSTAPACDPRYKTPEF